MNLPERVGRSSMCRTTCSRHVPGLPPLEGPLNVPQTPEGLESLSLEMLLHNRSETRYRLAFGIDRLVCHAPMLQWSPPGAVHRFHSGRVSGGGFIGCPGQVRIRCKVEKDYWTTRVDGDLRSTSSPPPPWRHESRNVAPLAQLLVSTA